MKSYAGVWLWEGDWYNANSNKRRVPSLFKKVLLQITRFIRIIFCLRVFCLIYGVFFLCCRKSSGFSRGLSKYRGVARYVPCNISTFLLWMRKQVIFAFYYFLIYSHLRKQVILNIVLRTKCRHHHNGRWEARIGRVFGNKYLYLGTYGKLHNIIDAE